METGHARLMIDWRFIEELLQLPEGVHVAGIYEYAPIAGMMVHLIGDTLPRVPRNQEPPWVETQMHQMLLEDGKRVISGVEIIVPDGEGAR
jgi:hypothetical protein